MSLPATVVSRVLSFPQPAKIATIKSTPMKVATVFKSFAQAVHNRNFQSTSRFALAFVHLEYESFLCFYDMFSNLSIKKVLTMY